MNSSLFVPETPFSAKWKIGASLYCRRKHLRLDLSPPTKGLAVGCFGSLALYSDGRPVHISNKKARELLALLLSEFGRPLLKSVAAETLWPETDPLHAMDNLYKACGAIRLLSQSKISLPLEIRRNSLWLNANALDSDILRFKTLYRYREEMVCCQAAIELYTAPFLMNECYEWSAPAEAYYDMRYLTLLDLAENHARSTGNQSAVNYYQNMRYSFDSSEASR